MIPDIIKAEESLDRGDYEQCINYLEKLTEVYPPSEKEGLKIRIILVTAYIGKGENTKAISTCKLLTKCKDKGIREKAKQLLPILEAPSLIRPSNWSIEIPTLSEEPNKSTKLLHTIKKKQTKKEKTYHPPTGITKDLDIGFSILVLIVIASLMILLD